MKIKEKIRQNKKVILLVLLVIIIIGGFLRTYHYHDWLDFGRIQARDAWATQDAILNHKPLPLLGPRASGTDFKLGPAFYYMQYLSARIFGTAPDKVAYPDLFFSILTIPLLFFFLKKYFNNTTALALTALYAVSYTAVQSGRFAWNPNSLPFFSILFLYAFLKFSDSDCKHKLGWAIIAGVALGIGAQLHTLYLIIFPIVFVVFSAYLIRQKILKFRYVAAVILVAFALNIPQIISEVRTGGRNAAAFMEGVGSKPKGSDSLVSKIFLDIGWHFQANAMLLTPFGNGGVSEYSHLLKDLRSKKWMRKIQDNSSEYAVLASGAVFSIAGYVLLAYFLKKESDEKKKKFLQLIALLATITFFVFIPLASDVQLKYFYILAFVPFLLLGLIIKFVSERYGRAASLILLTLVAVLCLINIYGVKNNFNVLAGIGNGEKNLLGEEVFAANFIKVHTNGSQPVYLLGEKKSFRGNVWALQYLLNSRVVYMLSDRNIPQGKVMLNATYFSFFSRNKSDEVKAPTRTELGNYRISDRASYGPYIIVKLEKQ